MRAEFFDPEAFEAMLRAADARAIFAAAHPQARALFEEYIERTTPVLPDFPVNGTIAIQFTAFVNDESPADGNLLATRSRFGMNLKVWDRTEIDWSKTYQIAWQGNVALRRADEALKIAGRLERKKLLRRGVHDALSWLVGSTDGDSLYGIFNQRSFGKGSRWSEVAVYARWTGDRPEAAFLVLPDLTGYEASSFEQHTAAGTPLGGRAIAQARIAYDERLAGWATDTPYNNS
jgi:hypothetical protein